MRQIILDTETTGLSPQQGHRVIEIGCIEMIDRRLTGKTFHTYIQPDRPVDPGAMNVHGITNEFLIGKPRFNEIAEDFKNFIKNSELIIHNAPFDVGFLEHEFTLLDEEEWKSLENHCQITDTLVLARQKHPGQRNNLDALCKRYGIDNRHRDKHGALLDAHLLAELYLAMTGGQNTFRFEAPVEVLTQVVVTRETIHVDLPVIAATEEELSAHQAFIKEIDKKSGGASVWQNLEE